MNGKQNYITESPAQTKKLGRLLAKEILKNKPAKTGRVLALSGDLGAGKTSFVQGFARGLGVKETVNSPTFTVAKTYPLKNRGGFKNFYHIDCYRLESGADLGFLDIKKIFAGCQNIVAIEWPDVAGKILPKNTIAVDFETTGKNSRSISFDF